MVLEGAVERSLLPGPQTGRAEAQGAQTRPPPEHALTAAQRAKQATFRRGRRDTAPTQASAEGVDEGDKEADQGVKTIQAPAKAPVLSLERVEVGIATAQRDDLRPASTDPGARRRVRDVEVREQRRVLALDDGQTDPVVVASARLGFGHASGSRMTGRTSKTSIGPGYRRVRRANARFRWGQVRGGSCGFYRTTPVSEFGRSIKDEGMALDASADLTFGVGEAGARVEGESLKAPLISGTA